ncbi:MAG TPA: cell division protein FtsL [Actinomycetota bacterium]|nr:cell division protein FtsL [Actinomycetota bacterium]
MSARPATIRERALVPARHLHLVRRKGRSHKLIKRTRTTRVGMFAVVGGIVVAAIVAGVLLEQVVLAQSAFRLGDLRKKLESADARHEELLLESAQLDSAARIERYARSTLGMVDPAPDQIEYIVAKVGHRSQIASIPNRHAATVSSGVAASDPYSSSAEGP